MTGGVYNRLERNERRHVVGVSQSLANLLALIPVPRFSTNHTARRSNPAAEVQLYSYCPRGVPHRYRLRKNTGVASRVWMR